jgi:hypothetical protein
MGELVLSLQSKHEELPTKTLYVFTGQAEHVPGDAGFV